jgi:hypothetical protein
VRLAAGPALAPSRGRAGAGAALGFAAVAALGSVVTVRLGGSSVMLALALGALAAAGLWLLLNERVAASAAVLLLYLGLLDGYVKLSSNSSNATLVRDVLLYAIVAGMLARAVLRGQQLRLPPLSGWVLAFVAVVLVQLANPANSGMMHSLGALRPHLEFVPLFFIGYVLVRSRRALYAVLLLLLVCAAANGVVAFVQLNQTPQELAAWGPGYASKVNGTGDVAGRIFTDDSGSQHVRPFGLGGDSGAGATIGLLSLGAALALATLATRRRIPRVALLLCFGPPLAIVTGERRTTVIAAFAVVLAFVLLATSMRRMVPTLAAVLVGIAITFGTVAFIGGNSSSGVFDRYKTISPDRLTTTTQDSRGGSFDKIPRFVVDYPVGGGLGSVGPAASFAGGGTRGLDGETEPTFLLSELGVAGLVVLLGFNVQLLVLAFTRVRRLDPELRTLLAALVAGLVGLLVTWVSASDMATSPAAPYFWLTAGVLAYWVGGRRSEPAGAGSRSPSAPA